MNTKSMKKHLENEGIKFVRTEEGWDAVWHDDILARGKQLGQVIWQAAREVGED